MTRIMFLGTFMLAVGALANSQAGEPAGRKNIGVTVYLGTDQVKPEHWEILKNLDALPGIAYNPTLAAHDAGTTATSVPYDFANLKKDLEVYAGHQLSVSVGLTPHLRQIPWRPQVDETGHESADRQNPFDPAFVAEWTRMHQEFAATFKDDSRIRCVYVAPPSYFGETEYYMGTDWARLKFLSYGPDARARFQEWLSIKYGSPAQTAAAWGRPATDQWAALTPPSRLPLDGPPATILANDWLDFTQWRTEYLTGLMATQMQLLADRMPNQEVRLMISWGDSSAPQATETAAIVARCAGRPNLALHQTNGHCMSDLQYARAIVQRYKLREFITENDGWRYSRTEIAKIMLDCLLAGVGEFNFSHYGHLVGAQMMLPTDSARTLTDAKKILTRWPTNPPRQAIAFLHSTTTRNIRAPRFLNRDVANVYDRLLSNEGGYGLRLYSWARWLDLPGVTGEQLILDGDLEGRKMIVIPNTGVTVLPAEVRARLLDWVQGGGCLTVFGADGFARELATKPVANGGARVSLDPAWRFPETALTSGTVELTAAGRTLFGEGFKCMADGACPVWSGPLPEGWQALLADAQGRVALAACELGKGNLICFPQAVPGQPSAAADAFYDKSVPLLLRGLAAHAGCRFGLEMTHDEKGDGHTAGVAAAPAAPLVISEVGVDPKTGARLFAGGAFDGSVTRVTLRPNPESKGPARLVLVDMAGIKARDACTGLPVKVDCSQPTPTVYEDPTNMENAGGSLIPTCVIDFDLSQNIELSLAPDF